MTTLFSVFGVEVTLAHVLTIITILFGTFQAHKQGAAIRAWWIRNWRWASPLATLVVAGWGGYHGWFTWLRHPFTIPLWGLALIAIGPLALWKAVLFIMEDKAQMTRAAEAHVNSIFDMPKQIIMFDCIWRLGKNMAYYGPPLCHKCLVAMKGWGVHTHREMWMCPGCGHNVQWSGSYGRKEDEVTELARGEMRKRMVENNIPLIM